MTLRTPRRRISPRTRKRYRAIKNFFKRAIGSSSQPDLEINSNIAVNVTDLNHKIIGLEQQLSEVSRTCRDFINLDDSRKGSQSIIPADLKDDMRQDRSPGRVLHGVETKVLYKTSENNNRKSEESDNSSKHNKKNHDNEDKIMKEYVANTIKNKKKNKKVNRDTVFEINHNLRKHKTKSVYGSIESTCSTNNFHSLSELREVRHYNPGYSGDQPRIRSPKREQNFNRHRREKIHHEQLERFAPRNNELLCEEKAVKHAKNKKNKHGICELDQDFITDIIKRQYKPVKMFGRRKSDLSQFSAPMCRDREFTLNENMIQEETELCSCCYGGCHSPKRHRHSSDSRSVCDARLYCSKKNPRFKYRRVRADTYNDSELYDLIPVKEKSSPKTRRKCAQDNLENYHAYKEVPPSPRTHRPRLNLKAQYCTESDEDIDFVKHSRRVSPKRRHKYQAPVESLEAKHSSEIINQYKQHQKLYKQEQIHQDMGTMSSVQYPQHFNIEPNKTVDTALNKTQETISSVDKTDRALCEIKDILQTFLQEIKNDASSSGKSDVSTKMTKKCMNNPNSQVNENVIPNSGHSFNNFSAPQCSSAPTPYMPHYQNPCCYPVVPMYPMNCMQTGYCNAMPSQSFTCGCVNKTDDTTDNKRNININTGHEPMTNETDNLIKEIYKLVVRSPTFSRKQGNDSETEHQIRNSFESRVMTSRSAGGSTRISKHDAKVGTPEMKCYSKSCEAIGSRLISDTYYSGTNAVYSDTILENLSLEATATTSSEVETEQSTDRSDKLKAKSNKFSQVLRSFGLFKKKKKDIIEELSESESTIDVEIKKKSPYRQEVTNYMMTGQDYYRRPPDPENHSHYPHPLDYRPPYNPEIQYLAPPANYTQPLPHLNSYHPRVHPQYEHQPHNYHPGHPSAPPHPYANEMQAQVPLCLKEIEVKSMGTQSERKMSFFRKIKKKIQIPEQQISSDSSRNFATQTKPNKTTLWQSLQAKAMEGKTDPLEYSFKEQKKFALGDVKMRNALLKKMFYKRNPFSPRNLIVKTLLGKDKSSYGEPPAAYRPRMFL